MLIDDATLNHLATQLGDALLARGWRLASAESLTGGWIAKVCTEVPGSSAWFDRGYVVYSIQAKQELLGIAPALIARAGVVSEEVAAAMASAALRPTGVGISVAVTGIAGPGGGTRETPLGTLCCACTDIDRQAKGLRPLTQTCQFRGDRDQIRRASVGHALRQLASLLDGSGIIPQPLAP